MAATGISLSVMKSAYISLIIGRTGLGCEIKEIKGRESFDVVRFDIGPLFQGQTRTDKLKSAYNLLITGRTGLGFEKQLIGNQGLGIV